MEATTSESKIYQLFVTLLESQTLILRYPTPHAYADEIKNRLYKITKIPPHHQRLVTGTRQLHGNSVISCAGDAVHFPSVWLTLRLRGGKGGFGSLLRGAATKAGQKKTSNFDACRDMSGRRLRHVNAEKRLEEWKAEEEGRRLEKKADEFLKKMAKKGKKGVGDGEAEKYVAKYREESERCVSEVLDSVREAVKGKRKVGLAGEAADGKRLKIWMGKQKLAESDSEDSDDEKESEKSVVLNNGSHSDSSKEAEGSSGSVIGGKQNGDFSPEGSPNSVSEEEKEMTGSKESVDLPYGDSLREDQIDSSETVSQEEAVHDGKIDCNDPLTGDVDNIVVQSSVISTSNGESVESKLLVSESCLALESDPGVHEEACATENIAETEKPLNFDEFDSAAQLEALGMERLKSELQTRGLKCGGTLQERAARLFLLKSTPLDKLPKKLLAKK
ncbi:hypothetical protein UlMin_033265 [Ulmus minor]